jgi:hypothetical protein
MARTHCECNRSRGVPLRALLHREPTKTSSQGGVKPWNEFSNALLPRRQVDAAAETSRVIEKTNRAIVVPEYTLWLIVHAINDDSVHDIKTIVAETNRARRLTKVGANGPPTKPRCVLPVSVGVRNEVPQVAATVSDKYVKAPWRP